MPLRELPRRLVALALLGGLLAGCSRLADRFVYDPDARVRATPADVGLRYRDCRFPAADETDLHGWWVPGRAGVPMVLLLHGAAGNLSDRVDVLRVLHDRLGAPVFVFDYRGYDGSAGTPSEAGLYSDARGARAYVNRMEWDRDGIVLYGRGLGAAVALRSATESPPDGVVVESAFTSLLEVVRLHHPLLSRLFTPWLRGRFDSLPLAGELASPVLFLHGGRDARHPVGMAWRLYDRCPQPKAFFTVPGARHGEAPFAGGEGYWAAWERQMARARARRETASAPGG